ITGTPSGTQLGLNATVLGTAIQAIATNPDNITTITTAWGKELPDYLDAHIHTDQTSLTELYLFPSGSPAGYLADQTADVLAFIVNNARTGAPGGAWGSTAATIGTAGAHMEETIYPAWVTALAHTGCFAPDAIAQINQLHNLNIPNPAEPITSGQTKLPAPLTRSGGTWEFDLSSAGGQAWLAATEIVGAAQSISGANVGSPVDTRFVVPLP
ncbi:MAG: hypothetical protein FWF75_06350, partial [Propionibacteriaceae bacterium]|nr:hypothetical protein [Propionibacteriaceae bacterium]